MTSNDVRRRGEERLRQAVLRLIDAELAGAYAHRDRTRVDDLGAEAQRWRGAVAHDYVPTHVARSFPCRPFRMQLVDACMCLMRTAQHDPVIDPPKEALLR